MACDNRSAKSYTLSNQACGNRWQMGFAVGCKRLRHVRNHESTDVQITTNPKTSPVSYTIVRNGNSQLHLPRRIGNQGKMGCLPARRSAMRSVCCAVELLLIPCSQNVYKSMVNTVFC